MFESGDLFRGADPVDCSVGEQRQRGPCNVLIPGTSAAPRSLRHAVDGCAVDQEGFTDLTGDGDAAGASESGDLPFGHRECSCSIVHRHLIHALYGRIRDHIRQ